MDYLRTLIVGIAASCIACASGSEEKHSGPEVGVTAAPLVEAATTTRLRLLTFNTWMLPPEAKHAAPTDSNDDYNERADAIVDKILGLVDVPDIIVFNEVFTEAARARFSNRLFVDYPYVVLRIQHSNAIDFEQDSGLMLFSKLPFEDFPSAPSASNAKVQTRRFNLGVENWDGDNRKFPAQVFDDTFCPSPLSIEDCFAAKGVGMVRVTKGGRPHNIAFTHLQADMDDGSYRVETRDVRNKQLRKVRSSLVGAGANLNDSSVEETLVVGDLNAEGWIKHPSFGTPTGTAANPSPGMLAQEYGQGIWKQLDKSSFFDTWRTTSPEDEGITNAAGAELSRFDYFLMNGAGHYDRGSPSLLLSNSFSQGGCPQHVRRVLQNAPSDHIGVELDVGPGSSYCAPGIADNVDGIGRKYVEGTFLKPGESHWYRLDAGTYSMGFLNGTDTDKISYAVYPVGDLSQSLQHTRLFQPGLIDSECSTPGILCQYERKVYFTGTSPAYVHIFSPRGRTTGAYKFMIKRHNCSSEDFACVLKAGAPMLDPQAPNGLPYTGFFLFQSLPTTVGSQNLKVVMDKPSSQPIAIQVKRNGVQMEDMTTSWTHLELNFYENVAYKWAIRIQRSSNTMGYSVGMRTDLSLIYGVNGDPMAPGLGSPSLVGHPLKLICEDETDADLLGSDEIRARFWADDVMSREFIDPDVDFRESVDFAPFAPLSFLTQLNLIIHELGDNGSVDDWGEFVVYPLDPNVESRPYLRERISVGGGRYLFQYNLSHSLDP